MRIAISITLLLVFGLPGCVFEDRCVEGVTRLEDGRCVDIAVDTGTSGDSGTPDVDSGTPDTGPPPPMPPPPVLVAPVNGANTGSVHTAPVSPIVDHPLRPRFTWLPTADADEYEIQLDDSCPVIEEVCDFPSPEMTLRTAGAPTPSGDALVHRPLTSLPVSMTLPVGARYVWRMRACIMGACGDWGEVRYLNVGRHDDDFDGDGYGDLVVGARWQANEATPTNQSGRVFIHYGVPGGMAPRVLVLDSPTGQHRGEFGYAVASAGDLNGDGYADLVIGASRANNGGVSEGMAFIYYGSDTGLPDVPSVPLDNPSRQDSGFFGRAVAGAGDLDGNGYADIVIGAYGQTNGGGTTDNEGHAFVYYSSSGGVPTSPSVILDNPTNQADGHFGLWVAGAGDLDGNGYADIAIGANGQSDDALNEGQVFVYYGSDGGISDGRRVTLDNPTDQAGGGFGGSVAGAGDVNGDGYADLVVGAPGQSDDADREGNAFVYYGSDAGVRDIPSVTLDNPEDQLNGGFGVSVASAGDLDGDGYSDLVVGAWLQNNDAATANEGHAFVYYGSVDGVPDIPTVPLDNPEGNQPDGNFGYSVACAGDLDGNGYPELAVGAYRQTNNVDASMVATDNEGLVYLYRGSATRVSPVPSVTLDNPSDQPEGRYGWSLACADDHFASQPGSEHRV